MDNETKRALFDYLGGDEVTDEVTAVETPNAIKSEWKRKKRSGEYAAVDVAAEILKIKGVISSRK